MSELQRTPTVTIVPFGKYRGQPVEALAADQQYCDWLTSQDWFRARYTQIHTLIVNNFGAPQETPEHNALQARFLDPAWRARFVSLDADSFFARLKRVPARAQAACAGQVQAAQERRASLVTDRAALMQVCAHEPLAYHVSRVRQGTGARQWAYYIETTEGVVLVTSDQAVARESYYRCQQQQPLRVTTERVHVDDKAYERIVKVEPFQNTYSAQQLNDRDRQLRAIDADLENLTALRTAADDAQAVIDSGVLPELTANVDFEDKGVDVRLDGWLTFAAWTPIRTLFDTHQLLLLDARRRALLFDADDFAATVPAFAIECKPTLGDDYPAVLRQMRASSSDTLLIAAYTGMGATLDQVRDIFGAADIAVVTVAEVEEQTPLCVDTR